MKEAPYNIEQRGMADVSWQIRGDDDQWIATFARHGDAIVFCAILNAQAECDALSAGERHG